METQAMISEPLRDKSASASVVLEPFYSLLERATNTAPTAVFVRAMRATLRLWEQATAQDLPWREPFVCINDAGEVVLEWWGGNRVKQLTLYFTETSSEFLQSWGTDIELDMREGVIDQDLPLVDLWRWLVN